MPGLQMSGLASGLDTDTIISQLMTMERRPRARIERQQAAVQARQDALRDIVAKLKTLKFAAADLKSVSTWTPQQTATSTDATRVSAKITGAAASASYDVRVTQLATREAQRWTTQAQTTPQTLTITQGATSHDVSIAANATADDIAATINGDSSLPVSARVYNGQLLVESKATGTGNAFTLSGSVLNTRQATTAGVNTNFTVNGLTYSTKGQTDTTAIPGVELQLNALTTGTTTVRVTIGSPAPSSEDVAKKAKAFVEAYNAVVDATRSRLTEKRVPNAATTVDAKKGVLFGDSGLSGALSSLRMATMTPFAVGNATGIDELAEIGMSTGAASSTIVADSVAGKITFDEAKFKAAFEKDPASVERLLKGAAARLESVVAPMTDTGGLFEGRITAATSELTALKDSLSRMDLRLERKETFLRRQFTALETAMQRSQMQQQDLASRLPSLSAE